MARDPRIAFAKPLGVLRTAAAFFGVDGRGDP
jgi:hypothetical protein